MRVVDKSSSSVLQNSSKRQRSALLPVRLSMSEHSAPAVRINQSIIDSCMDARHVMELSEMQWRFNRTHATLDAVGAIGQLTARFPHFSVGDQSHADRDSRGSARSKCIEHYCTANACRSRSIHWQIYTKRNDFAKIPKYLTRSENNFFEPSNYLRC